MEMEMKDDLSMTLGTTVERLAAAAGMLEHAVERLAQTQSAFAVDAEASIGRIVATVDSRDARRESELEAQLAAAELKIAELQAHAAASGAGSSTSRRDAGSRKTLPSAMTNLLAKQGVALDSFEAGSIEAGSLDAALGSLSIEQRIAVKSQLIRAGLLG